ncbi:peptide ABC transporter substrate-binding protein [Acuticoccus sediminis]|uniref:Peptide ABC transporter substrate-binding protein n=1 Tax=Acuticoccus sediminis TaxID=2184697 RepID=A0A8B2P1W2_9HYPH|nr:ABC transporter substrate-binding protein [Acuticoccus sediminis]RAI02267.1 peptide ABC transporter substrate-binding protein [Acuticoccus sediminis]
MRLWRRTLLALAASATLVSLPVAAQDDPDKTLVVGTMWESLPLAMAPRRSRFFNESEILDTLVKLDYDMSLVPGLATAWEHVSPKVWRFEIRSGVTFHDGTALDAEAVKASLQHVIDLLPYAADLLNIERMEATGPLTLEIETTEPFAALPNQLTDAITVIYAASSFDADGKFVRPVGTGPWTFVDYVKQDRTVVERFDAYWGEAPALERVVYRYIPDHNARTLALETGEIDVATNPLPSDATRLADDPDFKVYAEPTSGLYYGAFNTAGDTPLADRRVRLAVNALVDREILVKGALDGIGEPAYSFFGPQFDWVPDGVTPYAVDREKAAALLEEAGYSKDGGRWTKDGEPLTLRILSYSSRTEMSAITEALAALLANEGIASEVQLYTWDGMLDLVRKGEYDVSVVFWTPEMTGHPDLHLKSQFHSGAELNDQGWANPRFDELVDRGRTLDPGAEWDETYREALQILQDDAPIIPLVHKVFLVATSKEVTGYRVHPSGFFFDFKSVSKSEAD